MAAETKRQSANDRASGHSLDRLVLLLTQGIEAAEGAKVVMEAKFDAEDRCPYNSDNYCRLLDWMAEAKSALREQQNTVLGQTWK